MEMLHVWFSLVIDKMTADTDKPTVMVNEQSIENANIIIIRI